MRWPPNGTQITERVGVDKQREAYKVWAAKPSAYRE